MMFFHRILLGVAAAALFVPAARADLRVEISGVDGPERENVEARLGIKGYADDDGEDEAQIRRLHRQAEDEIRIALQAYGWYEPRVRGRRDRRATGCRRARARTRRSRASPRRRGRRRGARARGPSG